jgi:hypothetical protein
VTVHSSRATHLLLALLKLLDLGLPELVESLGLGTGGQSSNISICCVDGAKGDHGRQSNRGRSGGSLLGNLGLLGTRDHASCATAGGNLRVKSNVGSLSCVIAVGCGQRKELSTLGVATENAIFALHTQLPTLQPEKPLILRLP